MVASTEAMIRKRFLTESRRQELIAIARDVSAAHGLARRANAIVLLDRGKSCEEVASVLLIDDDTVRRWHKLYEAKGLSGLAELGYEGSDCRLKEEQQEELKAWITKALPRSSRQIGAFIAARFNIDYRSKSGLIALLHRLGMEHKRPQTVARKLDPAKQAAFIAAYNDLLNHLEDNEVVLFGDAVHPTHQARPVGCWAPKEANIAIESTTGRQNLNIHGTIDLETGQTVMLESLDVDATSTIKLLEKLQITYQNKRRIHLFLDNARYHHAKPVREWLNRQGCRIKLHFIPTYCPHLNPIERLWGVMHKNITHNRDHSTVRDFANAILAFLRTDVPRKWSSFRDSVSDNFRIIDPSVFRIIK
jgi:transposase